MNISLVAHNGKKDALIRWADTHRKTLEQHKLFATGTTGTKLEEIGFSITKFHSGPLGGDQEIGAKIVEGMMDMLFFFVDPLTAQPHEPDISALRRICDVKQIPIATNEATANILITSIKEPIDAV